MLTSQGDGELVFVSNLGASNQSVGALALQNAMVEDTAFGGTRGMTLLVADKTTNDIYRVTGSFNPGFRYSRAEFATLVYSAARSGAARAGLLGAPRRAAKTDTCKATLTDIVFNRKGWAVGFAFRRRRYETAPSRRPATDMSPPAAM